MSGRQRSQCAILDAVSPHFSLVFFFSLLRIDANAGGRESSTKDSVVLRNNKRHLHLCHNLSRQRSLISPGILSGLGYDCETRNIFVFEIFLSAISIPFAF